MKNSYSPNTKYLGIFLIVASLTLLIIGYRYELRPQNSPSQTSTHKNSLSDPAQKSDLQKIWENDLRLMIEEGLMHKGVSSIKRARLYLLDKRLHAQFKLLKSPFKYINNGRNIMEISFMLHYSEIEEVDKIIIQYNLINKKTKEMFWEFSRTVNLPKNLLETPSL